MPWLLDTNVCIHHWRGQYPQVTARWRQHRAEDIRIPLTVYAELLVGAEKSNQPELVRGQIKLLLEAHAIAEITEATAEHYARVRAALENSGITIGANDLWIAAIALTHGATLVTANTREFSRIAGLSLEDWSAPVASA